MSCIELYTFSLVQENDYVKNESISNYCRTVYTLHPFKYSEAHRITEPYSASWSLYSSMKCPACDTMLSFENAYDIHILTKDLECSMCQRALTYELLAVKNFVRKFNSNRALAIRNKDILQKLPVSLPQQQCESWVDVYSHLLQSPPVDTDLDQHQQQTTCRRAVRDLLRRHQDNCSMYPFDLVKAMYRQLDFVNKVCCNHDYWAAEPVLTEAVERYHKYLSLLRGRPHMMVVPTMDVDLAWHAHQAADNHIYMEDTRRMCGETEH